MKKHLSGHFHRKIAKLGSMLWKELGHSLELSVYDEI